MDAKLCRKAVQASTGAEPEAQTRCWWVAPTKEWHLQVGTRLQGCAAHPAMWRVGLMTRRLLCCRRIFRRAKELPRRWTSW